MFLLLHGRHPLAGITFWTYDGCMACMSLVYWKVFTSINIGMFLKSCLVICRIYLHICYIFGIFSTTLILHTNFNISQTYLKHINNKHIIKTRQNISWDTTIYGSCVSLSLLSWVRIIFLEFISQYVKFFHVGFRAENVIFFPPLNKVFVFDRINGMITSYQFFLFVSLIWMMFMYY